jgi:hypothetical protein
VEDVAARDGGELVRRREQLEAGGAAGTHREADLVPPLEYVDILSSGHLLPLLDAELVGDVVQTLDLVEQGRDGEAAQFCTKIKNNILSH